MAKWQELIFKEGSAPNQYWTNKLGWNPAQEMLPSQKNRIIEGGSYGGFDLSESTDLINLMKQWKTNNDNYKARIEADAIEAENNKSSVKKWLNGDISTADYAASGSWKDYDSVVNKINETIPDELKFGLAIVAGGLMLGMIRNTGSYTEDGETKEFTDKEFQRKNKSFTYETKQWSNPFQDKNYVMNKKNNVKYDATWVGDTNNLKEKTSGDGIVIIATGDQDYSNEYNIEQSLIAMMDNPKLNHGKKIKYIAVGDMDGADQLVVKVATKLGLAVKQYQAESGTIAGQKVNLWDELVFDANDRLIPESQRTGSYQDKQYKLAGIMRNSAMIWDVVEDVGKSNIIGLGFFQKDSNDSTTTDAFTKMSYINVDQYMIGSQNTDPGKVSTSMDLGSIQQIGNKLDYNYKQKNIHPSHLKNIADDYEISTWDVKDNTNDMGKKEPRF